MEIESSCTKKLLSGTLTDESLIVALRETEFDYQEESYQKVIFGYFAHQVSVAKNQMHCLAIK